MRRARFRESALPLQFHFEEHPHARSRHIPSGPGSHGTGRRTPGPRPVTRGIVAAMATALAATLLAFVPATKAEAAPVLLSQGKPVTASSEENYGTRATAAVDGDANTRWSSAASDPQWIRVDLGATTRLSQVVLDWETAYGKGYRIELDQRLHLVDRLPDHDRRRHGHPEHQRRGPLRPGVRHRARHRIRLLPLGVQGVRRVRRHRRPTAARRRRPRPERARLRPLHAQHPGQAGRGVRPAGGLALRQRAAPVPLQARHLQQPQRRDRLLHLDLRPRPQARRHHHQR
ncbi:hypothetical protein SVIOM74S_03005 [Streptomyces violarus]